MSAPIRQRRNTLGGGSIYEGKGGYCAYAWVVNAHGHRVRKYVFGTTYEIAEARWREVQRRSAGVEYTPGSRLFDADETAVSIVVDERVPMALTGDDRIEAVRRLSAKGLDAGQIAALCKCPTDTVCRIRSYYRIASGRETDGWYSLLRPNRRRQ